MRATAGGAAVLLLGLAGCGGEGRPEQAPSESGSEPTSRSPIPSGPVEPPPVFRAPAIDASIADAPRRLEGLVQDEHLGHSLAGPALHAPGGPLLWAASGGSLWGAGLARDESYQIVTLFDAEPRRVAMVRSTTPGARFGFALDLADGLLGPPGHASLVVAAPRGPLEEVGEGAPARAAERGELWVFDLASLDPARELRALASVAVLRIRGTVDGERFGYALWCRGDLDGDGVADLLVGAPGGPLDPDHGGRLWFVPGSGVRAAALEVADLEVAALAVDDPRLGAVELARGARGERLGASLDVARTAEGPRIAVGAPAVAKLPGSDVWRATADDPRGSVRLLAPEAGGAREVRRLVAEAEATLFGHAVRFGRLGGAWVLATGEPLGGEGEQADRRGAVHLHAPEDGRALARLDGPGAGARFGWSLAFGAEGATLAVGAPNDSPPDAYLPREVRTRRGSVALFALDPGPPVVATHLSTRAGEEPRDHLGYALAPGSPELGFWVGALAWPGVEATERGRVYALPPPD